MCLCYIPVLHPCALTGTRPGKSALHYALTLEDIVLAKKCSDLLLAMGADPAQVNADMVSGHEMALQRGIPLLEVSTFTGLKVQPDRPTVRSLRRL